MKGKKTMIGVFVIIGLVGVLLIGASMDFAGDMVIREARTAVKDLLGADLSVDGISGNPLKGFTTGKITLSKEEKAFLTAGFLEVKLNLWSLLSGSPKVRVISIGGVDMDADTLAERVAQIKFEGAGDGEIPIETVKLVDSVITSKWGKADVTSLGLSFSGKEITSDMDVAVNSVPVKGKTAFLLDGKNVDIRSLSLDVGKGSISASGKVAPSLAVSGNLKGLDLKELIALWPMLSADGFEGRVSLSFKGEGEWNAPVLAGDLDYAGKSLLGYPVDSVKAKWGFAGDTFSVTGLDARVLAMPLTGGMSLAFGKKAPVLDLILSGSDIKLTELKKLYPAVGDISGEIDKFTIKLSGTTNALSGIVEFRAPSISAFGYTVSDSIAQVKVAPKTATVSGKSVFEGAPVTVQGTVSDYMTAPKLNLLANLQSFNLAKAVSFAPDLKDLGLSGTANVDLTVKGTASAPEISGKVWSDKITAMKESVETPSVSFTFSGPQTSITAASAKWRGASVSVSGTVGADKKIDLTAVLENLQPGAIASFYPDIAQYKIKGAVTAKVSVTGAMGAPKIDLTLFSASLGLMDSVTFKNLNVSTTIAGDLKALEKADLDLDVASGEVSLEGIPLSNFIVKLKKTGQTVNIASASAKSGKGSLSGSGAMTMGTKPGDDGTLDLNIKVTGADLAFLSGAGGLDVPLSGTVNGTVTVKGPFTNPVFGIKAESPNASLSGMTASDITLDLSGDMKEMKIDEFKAKFGGGTLSGTGNVKIGATPDVTLDFSGTGLDLAALTSSIPDAKDLRVGGKANASFKGRFAGASGMGKGSITSSALSVLGLKVANFSYPVMLNGNTLSSKGASASFYGGKISGSGSLDIKTLKFSHSADFSGIDINSVIQDFTGGLDGKITGVANGSANISGALTSKLNYSGKGSATVGEGAVSGFKVVEIAAKLYGTSGIRYTNATIPFRLETGRMILERGTRANAPQNDPLYKSFTAEGPVGPEGALHLACAGNMNIQLINAITGGAAGGFSAGSLEDVLKGILGGAQKGMASADFRDVSFTLGGTMDNPSISNLKVAKGAQQQQTLSAPAQTSVKQEETQKEEEKKPEDILKEKLIQSIFK